MPESSPAGPAALLNRRFVSLLVISFFSTFLLAPLSILLPIYVEKELLRTPLFSGGLRALFLILGGLFAVPAGKLADDLGVKRLIVGHTPYEEGIQFFCQGKVWCIDVGMAAHYGGPVQVLEIEGDSVRVLSY